MNMNKKIMILVIFMLLLFPSLKVNADTHKSYTNSKIELLTGANNDYQVVGDNFCEEPDVLRAISFFGYMLLFAKLLIPLIIIVMGTMDFYKAVVADKSDEIKTQSIRFLKRIILGIIVFFIPTILNSFMLLVDGYTELEVKHKNCITCAVYPTKCITD